MENILNQLESLAQNPVLESNLTITIGIVLSLILGIVYCFFGYKAMRVICTIYGFLLGLVVGVVIVGAAKIQDPVSIIVVIAAAVIFAVLGFALFRAGVFVAVLIGASSIIYMLLEKYAGLDKMIMLIISLVAAVILAVLAAVYLRPVIIVVTAVCGALMFSNLLFDNLIKVQWSAQAELLCRVGTGVVLALIGMLYQFKTTDDRD